MWARIEDIADAQVLYLTTIGRKTGLPREIEIWFVIFTGRFYLFAETGEAARWVRNIRHEPKVTVRIGDCRIQAGRACARSADRSQPVGPGCRHRQRKYRWGD